MIVVDPIGTRRNVDGIHGQNVDGGLTLDNTTMRRFSDNAINGASLADGISATNFNGLQILNSTLEDSNRYHVTSPAPGKGDDGDEGLIHIVGIIGTVEITNSTLRRGGELVDFFVRTGVDGTGAAVNTLNMTVTGSTFTDSIKEFASGGIVNVGKSCIDVTVQGAANANVTIGNQANATPGNQGGDLGNTFTNCATLLAKDCW